MRVGLGIMLFFHGLHKLLEGSNALTGLGGEFSELLGLSLPNYLLGLSAALVQVLSGLALALGFKVTLACLLGLPTMLVAIAVLLSKGEPFSHYSHPIEFSLVLIGFALIYRNQTNVQEHISK